MAPKSNEDAPGSVFMAGMMELLGVSKDKTEVAMDQIELKLDLISAQLAEIKRDTDRLPVCGYDQLCIPGHHYWVCHNREQMKEGRPCLCGKEIF